MYSQLPDVPKRMLVGRAVVQAEDLGRRVFHEGYGRQSVCTGQFC